MFTCKIREELELKILEVRYADALYHLVNQNREHLAKWLPWVDKTTKVEDTIAYIEFELSRFAKNNGFSCGIFYQNEIVGCIGLHEINWGNKKTSIGYWLAEGYQGKGIMTDACRCIINYAWNELSLNRIEIRARTDNFKSRAIPMRLNFKHEGTIRQAEFNQNGYHDHEVYGILVEEWE
ncbi:ribosomal-protein-serine acetyltransferase [Paenibacillus sp. yr247]|uniref:GNAT family N-acetyltransferase n=1 Tax=Paenibacillus sp. yr247 TaxID=1761880 RepID=UPI00088A5AAF|nr:GNAT family protein [Paenibacillus sp. yr247]SDP12817.1 ribosomal-protein-serine acetyltransferase [Paenibacillus sp. yr247]